ncbi:hypothetical protein VNO80_18039 [Phaseolus coccineus]|uniref:Uncharacterized protein n=1 Tax=Phaseolus coccineus TaxID=3886 RepID=A0AAN9MDF4_PHACN
MHHKKRSRSQERRKMQLANREDSREKMGLYGDTWFLNPEEATAAPRLSHVTRWCWCGAWNHAAVGLPNQLTYFRLSDNCQQQSLLRF